MSDEPRKLFVMIAHSTEDDLSSVGLTIANGGLTAGLSVSIFLTSAGVDLARKGATDLVEVKPLDPLKALIEDFMGRGGTLYACTPCVKNRGYTEDDLLPGTVISGASVMHEAIKEGAATLSF